MFRALLSFLFLSFVSCQPVYPQGVPYNFNIEAPLVREYVPPEEGTDIGKLRVSNGSRQRLNNNKEDDITEEVVETPFGNVTFKVNHTYNGNCYPPCPDKWEVIGIPDGYFVHPQEMIIPEKDEGEFEIFPYTAS